MAEAVTLRDIERARDRIAPMITPTPLVHARWLTSRLGADVHLKLECFQTTGSFKLRGAAASLTALAGDERKAGVLAVSAGNHGLAIAHVAAALGLDATIVVPRTASRAKVEAIARYPATLVELGENYDEAEAAARELARELRRTFISPYNDPNVIAGAGTIALELLEAQPDLEVLVVPVGGGGLLAGIAVAAKALKPKIAIYAAEPANSPTLTAALAAGGIIAIHEAPTIADGLAGNIEADAITYPLVAGRLAGVVTVSEDQIRAAMHDAVRHEQVMLEGSAAVALAGALALGAKGSRTAIVLTGRNVTWSLFQEVLAQVSSPA